MSLMLAKPTHTHPLRAIQPSCRVIERYRPEGRTKMPSTPCSCRSVRINIYAILLCWKEGQTQAKGYVIFVNHSRKD